MNTQSIPSSMTPEIIIQQISGNLSVKGWDEPQIVLQADTDDIKFEQQDDILHLNCLGDCNIRLPHNSTIKIDSVHGDAHIKYLHDELILGVVHGSLTLRTVAETKINTVHGDFSAKEVDGSLLVESIYGNAAAREIMGDCYLQDVQGNLDLRKIEGQVSTNCDGNVRLRLDLLIGTAYHVQADGNLHCNLPKNASTKLILSSDAEIIKVKSPESAQVYRQSHLTLDLGESQTEMTLSAGGGLYVSCDEDNNLDYLGADNLHPEDFSHHIAQQVEAQISSHLELMSQQLNEQMERMSHQFSQGGLSPDQADKILEQARQASERGKARAQEKLRLAQEKLERKLEATRRQQERKARAADERAQARSKRSWGMEWPSSPQPAPTSAAAQVSEEERLMILRMLEQKKISLEEADRLLSALEGKE